MRLLEIIRTDWTERLPFHLHMNRYRGLARLCFQILAILYYSCKAILLFLLSIYYFFFKGIWLAIKWIFKLDNREWFVRMKERFGIYDEYEEEDEDDEDDYDSDSFWNTAISVENMDGAEFEHFCADLLRINGYTNVRVTAGSGDQSIDILAEKDDMKWAFQCKRWGQETHVGNDVVQKTFAGKAFYHCDIAVVITTSTFTRKAEEYARETGVLLWGQDKLYRLMEKMQDTAQTQ